MIGKRRDARYCSSRCRNARFNEQRPPRNGIAIGAHPPTYRSWLAMRTRATNPRRHNATSYIGRGIRVCKRWNSFALFVQDMGCRPRNKTIDRIDVDGDYKPSNCRWATRKQQAANKRRRNA